MRTTYFAALLSGCWVDLDKASKDTASSSATDDIASDTGLDGSPSEDGEDHDRDDDGYTSLDCNDDDATIYPAADEVCCDTVDQDCDDEPDDGCMCVSNTPIVLEPDAGTATYYVNYPPNADETVAFLAVSKLIEHGDDGDDQCDFQSVFEDEGGRYRFDVTLEHCGYGRYGSDSAFEAQAVVFARVGGVGGFTYFDLDTTSDIGGDHLIAYSTDIEDTSGSGNYHVCAVGSADGEDNAVTEWDCDPDEEFEEVDDDDYLLEGDLYENNGNPYSWVAARFTHLSLGANLEIEIEDDDADDNDKFYCHPDETIFVEHSVATGLGEDHLALILLTIWDTDGDESLSFESSCEDEGDTYSCAITCYGAGSDATVGGRILFVDGTFVYPQ